MPSAGIAAIVKTAGNPDVHVILRGGTKGPNYSPEDVQAAAKSLQKIQPEKAPSLMVDASHGNSQKDYRNQPKVRATSGHPASRPDADCCAFDTPPR